MRIASERPRLGVDIGSGHENATVLRVSATGDSGGPVWLTNFNDGGNDMGFLPEPGKYDIRIEKCGRSVTYSIGTMENGVFTPQLSRLAEQVCQRRRPRRQIGPSGNRLQPQ